MRNERGQFLSGSSPGNRMPVGTIRIRTRHKRYGKQRVFIKIADPNIWIEFARFRWEQLHGPIPRGMGIHHKDENSLNDEPENLVLVSKAQHLGLHRPSFEIKRIANFVATRRKRRWSTKSDRGKHVGRHPLQCDCPLHAPK